MYVLIGYVEGDDRPNDEIIKESKDLFLLKKIKTLLESKKELETIKFMVNMGLAPENYKNLRIAEIEYIKS